MLRPGSAPRASPQTGVPQARWWRRRPARPSAGYQAGTGRAEQYGQFVVLEVPAVIDAVAEQGQTPRGKMPRPWPDRVTSGPSSRGPRVAVRNPGRSVGRPLGADAEAPDISGVMGSLAAAHVRVTPECAASRSQRDALGLRVQAGPAMVASTTITVTLARSSSWPYCSASRVPLRLPGADSTRISGVDPLGRCGGTRAGGPGRPQR